MRSTFRVLFYVKKGSARPNGDLPLMCRLTVDGEVKQFSCKMDVPPRLWDVKNGRATGKSVEAMQINLAVDKIRVEVNRRYQELMQSDGYVTVPVNSLQSAKGSEEITPHGREVIFAMFKGTSRHPPQDYKNFGTRFRGSCTKFHRILQQCAPLFFGLCFLSTFHSSTIHFRYCGFQH